jgi:photosystem II stability/assembly factor-like uncharacterized protein
MRRFSTFHPWPRAAALAAASVLVLAAAPAQSPTWIHQAPEPGAGWNRSVQMLSPSEAWAVHDTGVMHTTDGGKSWTQANVTSTSMWALFFLDPQHGWVAGNGFWHTTNGGQTWIQDNNWGTIDDLHFIDAQRGWACGNGGTTYRTTNGGLSWTWQTVPNSIITLRSIFFVDALTGWTVNIDGDIFKSTDGGQSWSLSFASGASNLCSVQFTSPLEGWAIGGKSFLHTTDGGQSWVPASVPAGTWAYGAWFSDRFHGWAVGEGGFGVRTLDAGQTWIPFATPGPRLWDVHFTGTQIGMYLGEGGALSLSTDGGQSWGSLVSGGSGATHALDAMDAKHAWAANSHGEILYTTNGGAFWNRVPVSGFDGYGSVNDVDFADLSRGWAVGEHKYFGGHVGQIVRSSDGGKTWSLQASYPGAYMDAVVAVDTQTAYAFGSGNLAWKTTNGGQSWLAIAPPTGATEAAHFLDAQTGWTVGGLIRKTTDGGQSWVLQHTPQEYLYGVSFADSLNGWAVGWYGMLLRTVDGGQTWTQQSPGTSKALFDVHAVDAQTAWIAGGGAFVARTTNGGQTWVQESLPKSSGVGIEGVAFIDADYGWVGGDGIWRRDVGGPPCAPSPLSYCTAKPNSAGGLAHVSWSGSPSASAGNFALQISGALALKPGSAFFGTTAAASLPFLGGMLCAQPPLTRLPVHFLDGSGATSYAIAVQPSWVGTKRWYQFWYRDPAHPDGTGSGLSDALEVTFCD